MLISKSSNGKISLTGKRSAGWREVIALTAQEAEYSSDDQEKAELYQKAGDLSLERFDDVDHAIRFYERLGTLPFINTYVGVVPAG